MQSFYHLQIAAAPLQRLSSAQAMCAWAQWRYLEHEVGDDAVEGAALEVQRDARRTRALLARAQRAEVLHAVEHNGWVTRVSVLSEE